MKKKREDTFYLAGHQRSWIWGRHAVSEVLDAGRWPVRELFLADTLPEEERLSATGKCAPWDAITRIVDYAHLRALCGHKEHQGYLARMGPFPYAKAETILNDSGDLPCYILLDGIRDAHNFGAIIRSAAALGATAVIAGNAGQSPVNSHTVRASAGAVNRIPIALEDSLSEIMQVLHHRDVQCLATDAHAETPLWACDLLRPTAFLFGNEGRGIREELLNQCDAVIAVPLDRSLDSLNVSATTTVMLYEVKRQRALGRK